MLKQLSKSELTLLRGYIKQNLSIKEICKLLKYYPHTITRTLKENNISYKTRKTSICIKNLTENQELEIIQSFNKHKCITPVKKIYKCGSDTIKKILIKHNIHIPTKQEYLERINSISQDQTQSIIDLYTKKNLSISAIGKLYNVSGGTISHLLRQHKTPVHIKSKPIRNILIQNKQKAIEIYNKRNLISDVAKYFKTNAVNITTFFKSENMLYNGKQRLKFSKEDMQKMSELHWNKNMTMEQIGKDYNCVGRTIAYNFDKHKIRRRNKKEATQLGNIDPINAKKRLDCSYTSKSYTLPSGGIIKLQGYEPQFLDFIFSKKVFKEEDIGYDPKRISYIDNCKQRYYFPDFFIQKLNLIIEIKSTWVLKRQTLETTQLKKQACLSAGFNYLLILDNNFQEFETLCKTHKEAHKEELLTA